MADSCFSDVGRHYCHAEKTFIEESNANRKFQNAKEDGKVICRECYYLDGKIMFFTSAGVEYHYRRAYKPRTFEHDASSKLFHEMHFNETKSFIEQLSKFTAVNHVDCNTLKEHLVKSEHLKNVSWKFCS